MDLSELEATSGRLLEDQKRLRSIESELEVLKREIREMPRREQKDKSFYALIGLNYEDNDARKIVSDLINSGTTL